MDIHKNARLTPQSRALLVRRVLEDGWSVGQASDAGGVSERTGWKWVARFREGGLESLADRSSRPRRSRGTGARTRRRILQLRRARLTCRKIASKVRRSRATVARILKAAGLSRLRALDAPPPPVVRYEYNRPGGLLHLDTKKLARIDGIGHRITGCRRGMKRGIGYDFAHICIDDYSRVAYVEILPDECGATAAAFFRRAVAWFAMRGVKVERVLTDNGTCYRSHLFAAACAEQRFGTSAPSRTLLKPTARPNVWCRHFYVSGPIVIRSAAPPNDRSCSAHTCTSTITIACTRHSTVSHRSLG